VIGVVALGALLFALAGTLHSLWEQAAESGFTRAAWVAALEASWLLLAWQAALLALVIVGWLVYLRLPVRDPG
jgi:hypothetical protein